MDRVTIEAFVRSDYPRVVAAVGFACGDRSLAEDAVQDVLAGLLVEDREIRSLPGWVVAAALNRVRSGERRRGAEQRAFVRLASRPVTSGDGVAVGSVEDDLLVALRRLPTRQREIVALHYLLDMSVDEVAATLGVSDGTVKTQLHRARATLRGCLGDHRTSARAGVPDVEEVDDVRG
ncbi:MAG: sigma-70 family RNA polymerase sigma factor [Actinobacteria bacterium]|nr:sigma-70 family RNA polymerase sigma factor [Actinomycetota bacterium]